MTRAQTPSIRDANEQSFHLSQRSLFLLWGSIVAAGFLVRALASLNELWLDEVISLNLARWIRQPWQILTATEARNDNNHPLNTLLMHLLRDAGFLPIHRLPSVLAGTGSIVLACAFARRWGDAAATFAALVTVSSFMLIEYSSEARGYGLLVCFTLAALLALDRGLTRNTAAAALIFNLVCILGMLAHLLFLHAWLALLAWTIWRLRQARMPRRRALSLLVQYHLAPTIAIVLLYVTFMRHIFVLGAPIAPIWRVLNETAEFTLGAPAPWALGLAALAFVAGPVVLWRRRHDEFVLFFMLCVGAPAIVFFAADPVFVLPRYFILPVLGLLLLISSLLGHLFRLGTIGKTGAIILLALFIVGNSRFTNALLRDGRGHYLEALTHMAEQTPADVAQIRLTADNDFRHSRLIALYANYVDTTKTFVYIPHERAPAEDHDWVLIHRFESTYVPPTDVRDKSGRHFRLDAEYPSGPLAGWRLFVYRRVDENR